MALNFVMLEILPQKQRMENNGLAGEAFEFGSQLWPIRTVRKFFCERLNKPYGGRFHFRAFFPSVRPPRLL